MNQNFVFQVASYRKEDETQVRIGVIGTSGSQETRARRRVLDHLHAKGWFVGAMKLVHSEPAKRKES